jgi:hypothetical protein
MRKWLILAFLCSTASVEAQTVWTWVDSAGVRHYSDRPEPDAQQIELGSPQTYSSAPRSTAGNTRPAQTTAGSQAASASNNRRVAIATPAQDETLWNIGGTVTVSVAVQPQLERSQHIDLYFDGRRLGLEERGTSITLTDVFRGTHTVQAVIIDSGTRSEVQRSDLRTFHVQQTSVQNPQSPARGPALQNGN